MGVAHAMLTAYQNSIQILYKNGFDDIFLKKEDLIIEELEENSNILKVQLINSWDFIKKNKIIKNKLPNKY